MLDTLTSERATTVRAAVKRVALTQLAAGGAAAVALNAIARELGVSERTLRRRVRLICDRLGVKTPIEAVVWAARNRLI